MKRNDYIKLLSAGLLHVPQDRFQQLTAFIEQRFEIKELRKINAVSIGGQLPDKQYVGLIDWAIALRKEQIESLTFFYGSFTEKSLPAHIAAAFAGVEDIIVKVTTASQDYFYILQTHYSPRNEMTPLQLAELVNAQHDPAAEWKHIEKIIQDSNDLNNRNRITEGTAQDYLINTEGSQTFEWQAGDFIKDLQLNAIVADRTFIIPESLKSLLYQSTYSFGPPATDIVYLYTIAEATAEDVLQLVSAQSFAEQVWTSLETELINHPSETLTVAYTAQEWPEKIRSLTGEHLRIACSRVCVVIRQLCETNKLQPVIPTAIRTIFGPDETDLKRIKARTAIEDSQWLLTANSQPWEANVLELIDYKGNFSQELSEQVLKKNLQNTLDEITAFATKHQSYFAEAFKLATYFLNDDLPEGSFDEAHKNIITAELKNISFSEQAIENFSNTFYYSEELVIMGWNNTDIFSFIACSTADVFGGMASWNDQYFEPAEEQEIYQRLSGALYDALKKYFVRLISTIK